MLLMVQNQSMSRCMQETLSLPPCATQAEMGKLIQGKF